VYLNKTYTDVELVDEAIAAKLSEQGYNNMDVPSEHIAEVWENEVEIKEEN